MRTHPRRLRRVIRIIAAIFAVYSALILASRSFGRSSSFGKGHPIFGPGASTLLIAHQGGNLERPDETLEAFQHSLNMGADVLELDVHLSADGHLMVIHDESVDRTTDGRGRIEEMTLAELKSLDAGYWWPYHSNNDLAKEWVPECQDFPWRGRGLNILTLDEVLETFPATPMVVEVKSGGAEAAAQTYRILRDTGRLNDVLVVSSNTETLVTYRNLAPQAPTGADRRDVIRFWVLTRLGLDGFASLDADALQVPMTQGYLRIVTPSFLRSARRNGLAVHVWTINDQDTMRRLLNWGVDGIITDRPTLAAELMTP